MTRKIMILNGSPRAKGNTAQLIEAFARGAREEGAEVVSFDLRDMEVHPCLGCFGGGKSEASPCIQKDDMDAIYPVYREADVVVLASPLYYWSISGQLKCAFDRLFAVAECDEDYRNPTKEAVLLMAAEGDGFEESVHWYDQLMGHLGWTDRGKVLAGGVMAVGDIEGNEELVLAEALGHKVTQA